MPDFQHLSKQDDGSVLLWTLLWLAGLAMLSWATVSYAMPQFEQKQRTAVMLAVAKATKQPLSLEINGFQATLSGTVTSDTNRHAIMQSLGINTGIFRVRERFTIVAPPASDTTDTAESDAIVSPPAKLTAPSFTIRLAGNVLTVDGNLASSDDALPIIQNAMDEFKVDIVSSEITESDNVAPSEWLKPVEQFIPTLARLDKPALVVEEKQFVLSGIAPDNQTHDAIVHEALARFSQYALIERISVRE